MRLYSDYKNANIYLCESRRKVQSKAKPILASNFIVVITTKFCYNKPLRNSAKEGRKRGLRDEDEEKEDDYNSDDEE